MMERRSFLKLLGLAPAAMLPAVPAIPESGPDEILRYAAIDSIEAQRLECISWLRSIGQNPYGNFLIEIWRRRGVPYQAVLHCYSRNAAGDFYLDRSTGYAAIDPPLVVAVTSEPRRVP